MSRTKSSSKSATDITLATFRLRQGLWDQFKSLCENNRTNATEALIAFIEQAVESGSLGAIAPTQTNTTTNIHDIDDRIKSSFDDGGIAYEAIYKIKEDLMDVINDLNSRVHALEQPQPASTPQQPEPIQPQPTPPEPETETETKSEPEVNYQSQLQPLHPEVVPQPPEPTPEPTPPQQPEPTPQPQSSPLQLELQPEVDPINQEIMNILYSIDLGCVLSGDYYSKHSLKLAQPLLVKHQVKLSELVKSKVDFSTENLVGPFNKVIRFLGYRIKNKQINKIETYWIDV